MGLWTKSICSEIFPAVGEAGWLHLLRKCRDASLAGADGPVCSSHRLIGTLNEPWRPLHQRWRRGIFLNVASTPPYPWRGIVVSPKDAAIEDR
jgi:hypothetical protein